MVLCGQKKPDFDGAAKALEAHIELAEASRARPDQSFAHFRYAECLHKKGDLNAAREQLSRAETLFHDMGMNWWAEQAKDLRGRIDRGEPFKWFAPYVDGPPEKH